MGIFDKFKNKKDDDSAEEVNPVVVAKPAKTKSKAKAVKAKVEPKAVAKTEEVDGQETEVVSGSKVKENLFGVLVKPVVTEKSSMLGQLNQYAFLVSDNANKLQIAKAIKEKYGVEPVRVNILNKQGRYLRYGKTYGRTRSTKKAIVFLPEGKSITIYEGV